MHLGKKGLKQAGEGEEVFRRLRAGIRVMRSTAR